MNGNVRFVEVHGYRRAYRMAGTGPPVLLIHGITDSSGTWAPVFDALAEHYTVIAPDLLGHGESAKPRADYAVAAYANGMRDLLSVLGVERVSVVGHSLGGGVAMQFAYQFPEKVERIALVCPAGMGAGVHPAFRLATLAGAGPALMAVTSWPVRTAVRAAIPLVTAIGGLGLGPDAEYVLRLYGGLAESGARNAFLRTIRAAADRRGQTITMLDRGYLAAHLPTLVVGGTRDTVIPSGHATRAHLAFPGSRIEIFTGAGHFPHHFDPDRFVALIRQFIEETEPAVYDPLRWQRTLRRGSPLVALPSLDPEPEPDRPMLTEQGG
ncbi:alpha/beta fold hydrolase [Nocardia caishijiensis]|uniref:Pimeloyl-ACP methyl ester carboxylesterase n=1 Tax=Nocardia caishijiensis TaxID=184756 RepID=A0ABQ6YTQ3_9NOCA|nr:alpha/beta fold hydrolase [Nocardia caishijiensis]KAF0849187.1 pimeloyl-ACP methyl ester carboxylesterase [Nocardia caishijiensis]